MSAPDPQAPLRAVQPPTSTLDAEQLRAVVSHMAVGMLVVDSHGLVIDTNPAAEALLGLPRVEVIGRAAADPRWQTVDLDGQPLATERHPAIQALRTGRPVQNVEMGVGLLGRARRWLMVNCVPLLSDGHTTGAVLSFVDAGKRRTLEHSLTQQSRRLRAVLEGTRTATWQCNVQTGEVLLDTRWAEILGLELADLEPATTSTWTALVHPDDRAPREALLQQHFCGLAETFECEYRMRHRDGSWRWVRDRGRVVSHDVLGMPQVLLGTHDDITQLKEAELVKTHHDDLMRALFELSPLGLQLLDVRHGLPVAVNDSLVRITGYSREELLNGQSMEGLGPDGWRAHEERLRQVMAAGHIGPVHVDYRHKSGRATHLVCTAVRVTNPGRDGYIWVSVTDATESHAMEQQLRAAASEDPLTGLANRAALRRALQAEIDQQQTAGARGLAVIFLDLDRFKFVNDTLGHNAGDEMLCTVAQRLRHVAEEQRIATATEAAWTVARLGGDEFVLVVPGACTGELGQQAAQAVMQALTQPYTLRQQVIHAGASIGVTVWSATEATPGTSTADAMLRDADIAMYEAKHAGRGRCMLFDDTMRARLQRAVVIENELRHAVDRGQLQAVYQPIVDLETGAMSSVEALLRWHHPRLGMVSPAEFIPVAEESGQISLLGEWILRTACLQWTAWQRENPALAPATISVNLSREQVALGRRVLAVVHDALQAAGMPARALQLEITEREVMKNPEQARELLMELSAMGVKLAMDDFGTGTSSLGCLRDYPFDTIKIDKSFVTNLCRDPQVLAVAHATVNVIENLGMVSVAEGIEDPAEVAALQAMGCRYGQGYFFAKPQPADKLLGSLG